MSKSLVGLIWRIFASFLSAGSLSDHKLTYDNWQFKENCCEMTGEQEGNNMPKTIGRRTSRRIVWVDYAKGLAIIGVFVLHSNAPENVINVVSMFCMPVFFLLSGFVFSIRKYSSFLLFLWNKLQTLVFPGLFFAVVPFAIERIVRTVIGDAWTLGAYAKWVAGYAINMRGREGYGDIPWFLTCLFLIEVGGYVLLKLTGRFHFLEWEFVAVGVVSVVIGYAYSKLVHIVLPWGVDVSLSMFGFFVFGYALRGRQNRLERLLHPLTIVPALALLIGVALLNVRQSVNVYMNEYGNIIWYLVGAFCGLWIVLTVCVGLSRILTHKLPVRLVNYWGQNTLVFYCVNASIYRSLIPFILTAVGFNVDGSSVADQLLCMTGAIVINLLVCSAVAGVVNRWLPGVLGRKRMVTTR